MEKLGEKCSRLLGIPGNEKWPNHSHTNTNFLPALLIFGPFL
ncbi:hypothetical protein PDIG_23710 [Penicillium digitatum PHI26]|uniref:Uncharacterized protein n=2 Tax=Penicillium digitatum TaxID=36651 RepID=K9GSE5_PEND2|nr:hypothetical protein PDIP_16120 [Penicillium digitatum Pd1]EKV16016.1 hypothetical protein PDIG_23710 [Penicillium digitatum PHI26]EKV20528.1 hypothetical protein PDIP_16120 [Penicillium digitatum Pd1]